MYFSVPGKAAYATTLDLQRVGTIKQFLRYVRFHACRGIVYPPKRGRMQIKGLLT